MTLNIKNIIIELDGPQHFKQISNWRTPEEQLKIDIYKMECALENNRHIIRILQENVLFNKNDWDNKLRMIINELLLTEKPTIKYIDIDNKYFNHRNI